jgi:hypothetical protein
VLIIVGLVGRALIERRRSYIFNSASVSYRPAFGAPREIQFSDVASIEKCTVPVPFLSRPGLFAGVCFHLRDGESAALPLDFPQSPAIWQRLLNTTRPIK